MSHSGSVRVLLLAVTLLTAPATANAARMQFHYAATDGCGSMSLKPAGAAERPANVYRSLEPFETRFARRLAPPTLCPSSIPTPDAP